MTDERLEPHATEAAYDADIASGALRGVRLAQDVIAALQLLSSDLVGLAGAREVDASQPTSYARAV